MKCTGRKYYWVLALTASALTIILINSSPKMRIGITRTKSVLPFLDQPVINTDNFSFVLNPHHVCENTQMNLIFVIPSAPDNFERRATVRKGTTYKYVSNPQNKAKLLFFTGMSHNKRDYIQQKIENESHKFGDIVQMDFEDSYKNIRLKAVSMLKFTSTFCKQTKFVIRTDDDIEVVVPELLSALEKTAKMFDNFILGIKRENEIPNRDPNSRWGKYYMPYEQYANETYPPFLIGGLLGYPIETVHLLYQAALRVKPIWLDDVYITGLCAPKVNVPILQNPKFRFRHKGKWAV